MTLEQNVGVVRSTKPQISLTFASEEDADRDERSRRRVNICKCRTSRCLWGDVGTFSGEFVETEPGSCSPNTNQVVCVPEQTKVRAKVLTFVKTYLHTYVRGSQPSAKLSESSERGCRLSLSSLYIISSSSVVVLVLDLGISSWQNRVYGSPTCLSQFFLSTTVSENEASNSREFGFSLI